MNKVTIKVQLEADGYIQTANYLNALFKEAFLLAQKYHVPQDYHDICQLALIEATRLEPTFDKAKGSTFLTYVRRPIRQVVQKVYGYSKSSTNLYNKVSKFMGKYQETHGILPNTQMIAQALSMTEEKIKAIFYGKPQKVSLESLGADIIEDNESTALSDEVEKLLEALTDDDKQLIVEYYYEEYTIPELAALHSKPPKVILTTLVEILNTLKGV